MSFLVAEDEHRNKIAMKKIPRTLLAFACLMLASTAWAQSVAPIVHEGTVDAPIEKVWQAWTTSEGLRSWLAPHAEIDLRIGGKMRTNYNVAGSLSDPETIENTILSFEPQRMLSFRVSKTPESFPFTGVVQEMWSVVYLVPVGQSQTRVRAVSLGFTLDAQSQAMRAFFEQGNATTFQQLQQRLGQAE